jgi:hypothetical protein
MKSISRRIRRLEKQRFGTAADIEFSRRLRERIQEGHRRVAEARAREGLGPPEWGPLDEFYRRRLVEAAARIRNSKMGRNSFR